MQERREPTLSNLFLDIITAGLDTRLAEPSPTTDTMEDLGVVMRNLDDSMDAEIVAALHASPGRVCGQHTAWDFHGRVWYEGGQFHEEVRVYRVIQGTYTAPTLEALRVLVNTIYGTD